MFNEGSSSAALNVRLRKRGCTEAQAESFEPLEPVLTAADYILLNGRQLASKLGVKYDFVKDMRLGGFQPPISGLTTLTYARNWLNKHPNFREDARILRLSRKPKLAVNPPHRGVGKSGELRLMRGEQRS
jgi:hypothetical protein